MIEGHGDDIYAFDVEIVSNFSTNIFPCRNVGLERYLHDRIPTIYNYPSPDGRQLRRLIAAYENVEQQSVIVTSGAVEAIYLVATAFGHHCMVVAPTFSEYADASLSAGKTVEFTMDLTHIPADVDMVWICNPNNPDGRVFDIDELTAIISRHPEVLFVIDQAYEDYTCSELMHSSVAMEMENLILIKSLTKKFALPGLRIGYIIASGVLIKQLSSRLRPWMVNSLAVEAGIYCFSHLNEFKPDASALCREREMLAEKFDRCGITCHPSNTNFMLCRLPFGKAIDLKKYLLQEYGFLIRECSNFHGLDERYFRIAAQTHSENESLIKAIESWLRQL